MKPRLLLAALAALASARPAGAGGQTITVTVARLRNTRGVLECTLFTERGFPMHPELGAGQQHASIRPDRTATCRFDGVPPGTYAVGVMHDENANGKMDFNWLHMPAEGYGFSNNHTHAFSAPRWKESCFTLEPGTDVVLEIRLRY
jgi:uncharacterized protein (DUF2141 family)